MNKHVIPLLVASLGAFTFIPSASAEDKVDFEKQIYPIFEAKCLKCHKKEHTDETGKLKKPKGGLVMDSAAGLKKGGKESGEKTLVAGKADESELYKVTILPISDEMAMPPEGKGDPLTDAEKALLKKWIDSGADFGTWKGNE
jgi:uncharacterized membrane protein